MLRYSIGVSVDGFINDRDGAFSWSMPTDEHFAFHLEQVRELGGYLMGRRLYEAMLVWETDPSLRSTDLRADWGEVWSALPKVVFSRTLDRVEGTSRLAEGSIAEEFARLGSSGRDVSIGGAGLAAAAIELGLVDELHAFRHPFVVGGGTPHLPPVAADIALEPIESRVFGEVIYESWRRVRDPRPGA